mmetsp:Transcript_5597/g.7416  ORF Transcript_5597/g.7416 Transcript_5597/m.7416 type:complete len:106 (+) Transcript_5597:584-901(+)
MIVSVLSLSNQWKKGYVSGWFLRILSEFNGNNEKKWPVTTNNLPYCTVILLCSWGLSFSSYCVRPCSTGYSTCSVVLDNGLLLHIAKLELFRRAHYTVFDFLENK